MRIILFLLLLLSFTCVSVNIGKDCDLPSYKDTIWCEKEKK